MTYIVKQEVELIIKGLANVIVSDGETTSWYVLDEYATAVDTEIVSVVHDTETVAVPATYVALYS